MLDRAEHWLGPSTTPAVRVLSFGLIHPRRIVGEQVRQALVDASPAVIGQLWAMSLQVLARFAFGLALWITWAVVLRSAYSARGGRRRTATPPPRLPKLGRVGFSPIPVRSGPPW